MLVGELMSRNVSVVNAEETIEQAARMMAGLDAGVLPVGDNNKLIGMITDRDIALRAIGQGKGPETKVHEVMTRDVKYCFDDQSIGEVTQNMGDIQVRRLPVLDREKQLVGILSLGDVAANGANEAAGEALANISRPGGQTSQSAQAN